LVQEVAVRKMERRTRRLLWTGVSAGVICLGAVIGAALLHSKWVQRDPGFHDDFLHGFYAQPHDGGWQPFGGTWQVIDGTMQNISDDRGAKLINGNPHWRDYQVEADVQLLSETGDAGFVVRTSSEETGVDAYHGYFAGLRDLDDTLIIGRADFGWHEFESVSVHSHVHTRTWYHLKVIAYGCVIAAKATTIEGESTVASIHDPDCIQEGRFGLQSYSTGALWRNLDLRPATENDLTAMLHGQQPSEPRAPQMDAAHLPVHPPITNLEGYQRAFGPMQRELRDNHADLDAMRIADLRLLAPNISQHVTVHGVVTLVSPVLFIQDSSGGIAIPVAHRVIPVQIGDAVEASGDAELHNFSSVLRDATVRLLWSHAQLPALAVTASQAATGAYDAQFIEVEGRLTATQRMGSGSVMLQLDEGDQSFVAISQNSTNNTNAHTFREGSRLRLRGICVIDKAFTGDQVPFAILLRSAGDVQMLEPPPWWSVPHLVEVTLTLLAVSLFLQLIYARVKRSRMRAVMEERERLAMEMHDTLAQSFAGLGFQLEALCEEARPDTVMHRQLESTLDLVRFGHMQARRNIAALRPGNLEQLGLAKALEQAARTIVREGQIEVATSTRGDLRSIPLAVSDAIFRIGQEAVANAVRHAHPHRIDLRVVFGRDSVKLTVRDDGAGFETQHGTNGFGIRCMKQRAERIGASFRIRSSPGHGTLVLVRARAPRRLFSAWIPRFRYIRWGARLHGDAA
jgi:signal transduction histidine kinase